MRRTSVLQLTAHSLRALTGLSLILLTGCVGYPDADERFDDEIIYTRYREGTEFSEYKTFAISPEVIVFEEDDDEIEQEPLEEPLAEQVIERTVENLKARGYEEVSKDDSPDLGVTVSILKGHVTAYYGGYWGSYWGYPFYGYYYPYYYTYSYNTGTLLTDVVDLKNAPPKPVDPPDMSDPENKLEVLWTGLVYGVLGSNPGENLDDGLAGIDQTFKQSPYFQAGE